MDLLRHDVIWMIICVCVGAVFRILSAYLVIILGPYIMSYTYYMCLAIIRVVKIYRVFFSLDPTWNVNGVLKTKRLFYPRTINVYCRRVLKLPRC